MAHGQFSGFKGLGVRISSVDTVAKNELGVRVMGAHGEDYVYVVAGAGGVTAGDALEYSAENEVITSGAGSALVGVAVTTLLAGEFGWVQVRGTVKDAAAAATVAAGDFIGRVAGAGVVADVAATEPVAGVALTAAAGGVADIYLF